MIPILYDSTETAFASNGLGRLRDCISCVVTEERNGIYECDFEYPIDGVNYDRIQLGRIIAVEHDESGDVQPFDIVSYSRPINGVVTFHAVHISYRQTALTCTGSNINSLADAFTLFGTALPDNPFNYWTDKDSIGFMASADGVPHSVRTMLGGMEGSVLDAYGGEYEWDEWTVKLWAERGSLRNFSIRYGVNLVNYDEELDYSDTYTAVVPYWKGQDQDGNDITIVGDMVQSGYPSFNNGEDRCIPLDVTDKFDTEDGQPTKAQIEAEGLNYINANQPYLPAQTLKVDFARITDSSEYAQFRNLQKCRLCDSINVIFPKYKTEGTFKIVKTEYDVLQERYLELELGTLSVTLSEALGINQEAANRVRYGGGGGGVGMTLLWTNPNPAASYGTTPISLALADYDEVEIVYRWATGSTISKSVRGTIGDSVRGEGLVVSGVSNVQFASRDFSITSSGVNVAVGNYSYTDYAQWYRYSGGAGNDLIIPYKVYGIMYR